MSEGKSKSYNAIFKAAKLTLAENVKAYRKDAGMTQEDLAFKLGTVQSQVSNLEAGKVNPTLETLAELAGALSKPIEDFLK